jgi:hypothetical protein
MRARSRSLSGLTLVALATFVALDLALRLLGLDRVLRLARRRRRPAAGWSPADGQEQARRTFTAVDRATMLYYRRRQDCLPRALAIFILLRRQGIPSELCFGVKKFPFAAHSWVETCGERLDDDPGRLQRYVVIHRVAG